MKSFSTEIIVIASTLGNPEKIPTMGQIAEETLDKGLIPIRIVKDEEHSMFKEAVRDAPEDVIVLFIIIAIKYFENYLA